MNLPARPMPKPTAQVAVYVEILGVDLAVTFLLAFGGAELHLAQNPKGKGQVEAVIGLDNARALAAQDHRLQRRVPLAKKWLAQMLDWQGHSIAHIARTLRTTDVSVRGWLRATQKDGPNE
ncbi:helix-turn-helix domain-containing protein [Pseudorhodobacter sp.]|uniref:helix-turn-helix domain-containing protein n=1 Tax=Pseudorhodobacter sp. TaxID=1934400 RepID=UPI002AFF01FE|nr:helix-turn-helix domain-containing protein [Pseudorhodobacter sp.]